MSVTELFPLVEGLDHQDKFRLMQFLVQKLAGEEGISLESAPKAKVKPIGRVYYSQQSDHSKNAKALLFAERLKTIQQRQKP